MRRLIDSGADVNLVDDLTWSALMVATWSGHFDIVRKLIDAGADPNLVNRSEWTALMYAAGDGRKRNDAVRMLVEAKANLNLVNKQNCSALMLAAKFGHTDTVRMLVDAGVDLNVVDEYNCSVLMLAASRGCTETVRTLIEAGANVNTRDDKGEAALRKASEITSHEIIEILLQHGARVDSAYLGVAQSEDVRCVLQLYHSSQQFHDKTAAMLTEASAGSPTSIDQVLDLVPFITSVYDLRLLLPLNSMADPPNEGKQADQQTTKLLNAAFGHGCYRPLSS